MPLDPQISVSVLPPSRQPFPLHFAHPSRFDDFVAWLTWRRKGGAERAAVEVYEEEAGEAEERFGEGDGEGQEEVA